MRARFVILTLLAGCGEADPCAGFAGETCIALRVNGPLFIDQLGIAVLGAFAEKPTPDPRREKAIPLPVGVAVLPGNVSAPFVVTVRGFQLGVAVGEGSTSVTLAPGQHTRAEVTLASTGVDLAGVDVAGVDLATPAGADLAGAPDGAIPAAPFFPANGGLNGGQVRALMADFAMRGVYVGTAGAGIFRSDDAGQNWTPANEGLGALFVDVLTASPVGSGYFAAVHGNASAALYRSVDGRRWTKQADLPAEATAIEFVGAFTMLVGIREGGTLRSMDNGVTLTPARAGIESGTPRALRADALAPGTVYAGLEGAGVFKTVDAGDNWTGTGTGLSGVPLALEFDPATRDLIAATLGGLFVLKPQATAWVAFTPAPPSGGVLSLAFAQQGARDFYLATQDDVFHLGGADATWRATATGVMPNEIDRIAMDRSDPRLLYVASIRRGVFASSNAGMNWAPATRGITNVFVSGIAIDPKNPRVLYAASLAGMFRSTDGGVSWQPLQNGVPAGGQFFEVAVHPLSPEIVYCSMRTATVAEIYRSGDGGAAWQKIADFNASVIFVDGRGVALAGGASKLKRAADGSNFVDAMSGLTGNPVAIAAHASTPTTLYVAAQGGGLFKSTNDAVSWQQVMSSAFLENDFHDVAIDPANPQLIYATSTSKIYKSVNEGATWALASTGFDITGRVPYLRVAPSNPNVLYATSDRGVFRSSDGAASWSLLSASVGLGIFVDLAVDPGDANLAYFASWEGPGVTKTVTGGK